MEVKLPKDSDPEEGTSVVDDVAEAGKANQFAGGMFRPFNVRNFNLLFGGQIISTIGDALYTVALPWFILNNGGDARELGIVLTAYGIPRGASVLLGGWLSDRLRPRRLMLIADTARALLVGILALLMFKGEPILWELCLIAVPLGAFSGAFSPASASILPDLLADDELQAGNALTYSSMAGANLIGSGIAGVVVAVLSAGTAMTIDTLSFAISAVSLAMMRFTRLATSGKQEKGSSEPSSIPPEETLISFGRFIRTSRLTQVVLVVAFAANFCFGGLLEVALPSLTHGPMHTGASGFGFILAAFAAGALAGGIFAGTLGKIKHKGLVAFLLTVIVAIAVALVPYGGLLGAIICMLIAGLCNSMSNVLLITLFQVRVPRHLLGRVTSLLVFGTVGAYPISVALGGVLTTQFGPVILFPFSGLLLALTMFFGIAQREVREL